MKKVLFATTALMLTGGAALAEVTIGGNGRFGLLYTDQSGSELNETIVSYRLRFNIDASRETDSGVTFGGRIRMQYSSGDTDANDRLITAVNGAPLLDADGNLVFGTEGSSGAGLSAAKLYASYEGLTLEVGNVDTAFDSAALLYNSELGYLDRSFGDPIGSYYSFSSSAYDASEADRLGIALTYSIGDFNGRISWVTPNQTGQIRNLSCDPADITVAGGVTTCNDPTYGAFIDDPRSDEISLSGDYTFGDFIVSAAYYNNGAGIEDNEGWFLGGEYNFQDMGAVGLLYIDNGDLVPDDDAFGDLGETWTLYGNYKINDVVAKGYIAYNSELGDIDGGESTVFGIGADYDLGGATLSGSIQQGFNGDATADVGVRFTF